MKGEKMKNRKVQLIAMVTLVAFLLTAAFWLTGCKKQQPAAPEKPQAGTQTIEQTICPVMEGPINKNVFTEYQGKKVYFCCSQCKADFKKNPERYISVLPQFKK